MTDEAGGRPSNRVLFAGLAGLLALSVGLQVARDRGWDPYEPATPLLWLHAGPHTRAMTLGFDEVTADVYWMRAVVYYGGRRLEQGTNRNYDLLYPLLDLVTTLDPRFTVAYRFGAIFLAEAYPDGPGRPDLAVQLLRRGLDQDPDNWEYMQDIGFIHYWWLHDYRAAARWFERAGAVEGAPPWLSLLAANTLSQGGDRQSSRLLWRSLLESSDLDWIQATARLRLAQFDALDQIDQLNEAADRFQARAGRRPSTWRDLATVLPLRGVPRDPAGAPYVLDSGTGRVTLSPGSPLAPLPTEPSTARPPA
ncbi:MAG: tetratricopeptide repeat protein [Vicinamibacterales bacterium]